MFPSWRHRGLIWANKRLHQAWPLAEDGGSMAEKPMQSKVNCSQTQRSHQLLFSFQKKGDGREIEKRDRSGWRKVTESWCLKKRVGLYHGLFRAPSHRFSDNLRRSPFKMSRCLLSLQSMVEHYGCGETEGWGGADERKKHSRWTKLVSNPFPLACLPVSLDLVPDL